MSVAVYSTISPKDAGVGPMSEKQRSCARLHRIYTSVGSLSVIALSAITAVGALVLANRSGITSAVTQWVGQIGVAGLVNRFILLSAIGYALSASVQTMVKVGQLAQYLHLCAKRSLTSDVQKRALLERKIAQKKTELSENFTYTIWNLIIATGWLVGASVTLSRHSLQFFGTTLARSLCIGGFLVAGILSFGSNVKRVVVLRRALANEATQNYPNEKISALRAHFLKKQLHEAKVNTVLSLGDVTASAVALGFTIASAGMLSSVGVGLSYGAACTARIAVRMFQMLSSADRRKEFGLQCFIGLLHAEQALACVTSAIVAVAGLILSDCMVGGVKHRVAEWKMSLRQELDRDKSELEDLRLTMDLGVDAGTREEILGNILTQDYPVGVARQIADWNKLVDSDGAVDVGLLKREHILQWLMRTS